METTTFFDLWPVIFVIDLLRYLIPASIAFLIFWVWGKIRWRHLFIQSTFPKTAQFYREFAYSMSTVLIFSMIGYGVVMAQRGGYTQIYSSIEEYGYGYLLFSFLLTLLFHDFYFYWTHRLMHHKAIFKHVHRVHHQSSNPSPWAAYSFHPFEAVIQALVLPIMVFSFPLHSLTISLFLMYMIVRNVMGHLGYELLPRGFTQSKWTGWHTTTTHHNMHHQLFSCNYGLYFSFWDKWMKTTHPQYDQTFQKVKEQPKRRMPNKETGIKVST